jgi:hypothetical protein
MNRYEKPAGRPVSSLQENAMNALVRVAAVVLSLVAFDAVASAAKPPFPKEHQNNQWFRKVEGSDIVIVFVHGIFSDSHDCWTSEKNAAYWPEIVANDKAFNQAGIYLAGYDTAIRRKNRGMNEAARQVFDALKKDGVLDRSNILFVCHSTGGIVTRYMLTDEWPAFMTKNIGLALYASPTKGSSIANVVGAIAKAIDQRLGFQLRRGSEVLDDLHDRFSRKIGEALNVNLVGMELCETKGVATTIVVNCESAGAYFGAEKLEGLNHFETVKPLSESDEPNVRLETFFMTRFRELMKRSDSQPPVVHCVSPPDGSAAGLFPILIAGEHFRVGSEARLGDVPLKIEKFTPTGLVVRVPANLRAGKYAVKVKNPSSEEVSNDITIHPVISNVTPVAVSVRGGELLTIRGHGFTSSAVVRVCGRLLENVEVRSQQEIVGTVPPRLASERCDVSVDLADGITTGIRSAMRYDPALSAITPPVAAAEQAIQVAITGTGFQPDAAVMIGGTAAGVRFDSPVQLAVTVPPRETTGKADVMVTHHDGTTTTLPGAFTYTPSISRIEPATGPLGGGNVISIAGTGFDRTTTVSFGDVTMAATFIDAHTLSVEAAPSQASPGAFDVTVRNGDGTSATTTAAYTYEEPPPPLP